jgi:6-phosphofructokinase 1
VRKIGILTSGGDCQGLNAAIRGIGKSLYTRFGRDVVLYGIRDGYRGLIEGIFQPMAVGDFSGILTLGGTILGTSRQPYKSLCRAEKTGAQVVESMKKTYARLGLDCLVILGGNGTHKTANLLSKEGLNIVTLPKTIDNDIWGTDITFGFSSAVEIATHVIDCIHTTATSHSRVFIVEIMGHKVGWLTLYAGIGGGADVILVPEMPYDTDEIVESLHRRNRSGKRFSILAVAEGAVSQDEAGLSPKELHSEQKKKKHPSVSYRLAEEIGRMTGQEIRVTVPGHIQRGGTPCPYDRVLATRFGTAAAELVAREKYGRMVAIRDNKIVSVPLEDVAGKLKKIPSGCELVSTARDIGVSFGCKI